VPLEETRSTSIDPLRTAVRSLDNGIAFRQSALVLFEITSDGVGPLRLGVSREQAGRDLTAWGQPRRFTRGVGFDHDDSDWMVSRSGTTIFVYCDESGRVDAIEFASPGHGVAGDDVVVFDEVDVFIDPADTVLDRLGARGFRVVERDRGYASDLPDVLLSLWRDGEPSDDTTGLPLYFESALVARPGYCGR
jgi:hypothetical protein